jgi:hypothetical protein
MKTSLKMLVAGSMAAVIVSFAAVAPASANPWPHPHPYGYGYGYGHGWGPVGLFGLAAGAAIAYDNAGCVRYQPIYDNWGNYIGQRPVNVCY